MAKLLLTSYPWIPGVVSRHKVCVCSVGFSQQLIRSMVARERFLGNKLTCGYLPPVSDRNSNKAAQQALVWQRNQLCRVCFVY